MTRAWSIALLALAACAACAAPAAKPPAALEIPTAEPVEQAPRPPPPAPSAPAAIVYSGQLWSNGGMIPVETTLVASDAGLRGSYVMIEEGGRSPGELSNCFASDGQTFTCMWQDEYGVGGLELVFADDRRQFNGEWWSEESPNQRHPWTGSIGE